MSIRQNGQTKITQLVDAITGTITSSISDHDEDNTAHSDIRALISQGGIDIQIIDEDDEITNDGFYLIEYEDSNNTFDDIEEDMLS